MGGEKGGRGGIGGLGQTASEAQAPSCQSSSLIGTIEDWGEGMLTMIGMVMLLLTRVSDVDVGGGGKSGVSSGRQASQSLMTCSGL